MENGKYSLIGSFLEKFNVVVSFEGLIDIFHWILHIWWNILDATREYYGNVSEKKFENTLVLCQSQLQNDRQIFKNKKQEVICIEENISSNIFFGFLCFCFN